MTRILLLLSIGGLVTAAVKLPIAMSPADPIGFLRENFNISTDEVEAVKNEIPIGRVLKSKAEGEIAIFGAIKLSRSKDDYIAWYKKVENFKLSPMVLDVGMVGNPPQLDSMKRVTFDPKELTSIRACQSGNCSLKLTPQEIQRFTSDVDWSATNSTEQASARLRQMWMNYVQNYLSRGNAALGFYEDKQVRVDLAEVFRELLDASPWLGKSFPESLRQLREYSGTNQPSDNDFIYWSKERYGFGMKPILNLFHVTILKPNPGVTLISSKQIRSSHYFDGSLGLTLVFDAPPSEGGGKACYLIYVNRSRIDLLRGGLLGFKRTLVQRQLPGEIKKQLSLIKKNVEGR